jgi:integrase
MVDEEQMVPKIFQRGKKGLWCLRYWVPDRFRGVEPRKELFVSLKTTDGADAMRAALVVQQEVLAGLNARLLGQTAPGGREHYARVRDLALARGFTYRPVADLAEGSLEELLGRVESLAATDPSAADGAAVAALLGGVERPVLLLSQAADRVEEIQDYANRMKGPSQLYVWKRPILRYFSRLRTAIGTDKAVLDLTQKDAVAHRDLLLKDVKARKLNTASARKELAETAKWIRAIQEADGVLDGVRPYDRVRIESDGFEKKKRKPEFSDEWIRATLLTSGPMAGLNSEARDIILIALETGCRQAEIHDLPAHRIFLDEPIPYAMLEHDEGLKEQKNNASVRPVPLMGVALAAMRRRAANGFFPRYGGTRAFSAAANKYFREAGLFPTPEHTLGGLRHSWEKRLKKAELESDDRGEMMGHSVGAARGRQVYGDLMTVEERAEIVRRVVFDVPDPFADLGIRTVKRPAGGR